MKTNRTMDFLHYSALLSAFLGAVYIVNNFLTYIFDLPGLFDTLALLGLSIFEIRSEGYDPVFILLGVIQTISFILAFFAPALILRRRGGERDEVLLDSCSKVVVSFAFFRLFSRQCDR